MTKLSYIAITLVLVSCAFQAEGISENTKRQKSQQTMPEQAAYMPGQLLVSFHGSVPRNEAVRRINLKGGKIVREITSVHMYQVQLPNAVKAKDALSIYRSIEGVKSVEFNYIRHMR